VEYKEETGKLSSASLALPLSSASTNLPSVLGEGGQVSP
jgi:hypothetical protein